MIESVRGVLLDADDATTLVDALEVFARVLAERGSRPTPKLDDLRRRLTVASTRARAGNARADASVQPTQPLSGVQLSRDFLTPDQAAPVLGISADGVRDLARRGRLPAVRAGGRWLLAAAAVEARAHSRS